MRIRCNNCGNIFKSESNVCPVCGEKIKETNIIPDGIPFDIISLKEYISDNKIELQKLHFYLCVDNNTEGAFVLTENDNVFTVYKIKEDKSRQIIYTGRDEYLAVNCFYKKLHSVMFKIDIKPDDIQNIKIKEKADIKNTFFYKNKLLSALLLFLLVICITGTGMLFIFLSKTDMKKEKDGYYNYFGTIYYHDDDGWYKYTNGKWYITDSSEPFFLVKDKYFTEEYDGDQFSPEKIETEEESTLFDWDNSTTHFNFEEESSIEDEQYEEIIEDEYDE